MFPHQNKKHCPNPQPPGEVSIEGFRQYNETSPATTNEHFRQQSAFLHLIRISFVLFFPVSVHFCLKHYQRNSLTFGIYELILRKIVYVLIVINILR